MAKRIFFVSRSRLSAYEFDGQLSDPVDFPADEDGLRSFSVYLTRFDKDPVYVLVDFVEEDFREDTVPHVFGSDRAEVVRTKLSRLFRDATYSAATFQGRDPDGRRDDRVLFSALIRPDLLAPWVSQIMKSKVPLAGIYSLPMVTEHLLKTLKINDSHVVLVSLQSSGGLRQSFFLNGKLKISRLALLNTVSPERVVASIGEEVEKLRRYLSSLRLLPVEQLLDVYILGPPALAEQLEDSHPDFARSGQRVISLLEAARKLGIRGNYDQWSSDRLFVHLLAKVAPKNQYAPAEQTRYFQLYNARKGMTAAAIFAIFVLLGGSAYNFVEGLNAVGDATTTKRQAAFYANRYDRARSRLPQAPAESNDLRLAVEMADGLVERAGNPEKLLATVSDSLEQFPSVVIDELIWQSSENKNALDRPRARSRRSESVYRDAPRVRYQLARIRGRIQPFAGDYRAALEMVRNFAQELQAQSDVEEVIVEALPLDIGSEARLSGDSERIQNASEAVFQLRVSIIDKELSDARS